MDPAPPKTPANTPAPGSPAPGSGSPSGRSGDTRTGADGAATSHSSKRGAASPDNATGKTDGSASNGGATPPRAPGQPRPPRQASNSELDRYLTEMLAKLLPAIPAEAGIGALVAPGQAAAQATQSVAAGPAAPAGNGDAAAASSSGASASQVAPSGTDEIAIAPASRPQPRVVAACQSKDARSPDSWLGMALQLAQAVVSDKESFATAQLPVATDSRYYQHGKNDCLAAVQLGAVQAPNEQGVIGQSEVVAVFLVNAASAEDMRRLRRRIELAQTMMEPFIARQTIAAFQQRMDRVNDAVESLDAINEQRKFRAAAMAFCNDLASRYQADRVSIGLLEGRYVKAKAMSHAEKFNRRTRVVRDLESAMEECVDQDLEVIHPRESQAFYVARAAEHLAKQHGPSCVVSVPLRRSMTGEEHSEQASGAVVLERPADRPFTRDEVETIRLGCEFSTARLLDLYERDKWFGAKLAGSTRRSLGWALGPKHTIAKLIAVLVLAAILAMIFVKGPDRVDASFTIEPVQRRVAPAPFAGKLMRVLVEVDDKVEKDQPLAELETADLFLRRANAVADRQKSLGEADLALRDGKTADRRLALLNARKAEEQIKLLDYEISQATVKAPIAGVVIQGDLRKHVGKPLEVGETMFEVAPLDKLRATLAVSEDRIADLESRIKASEDEPDGELVSVSHPGVFIPFKIERVHPVAEVVEQENVFKVRVRLMLDKARLPEGFAMKPGTSGLAKIDVGERSYGALWTRGFVNWVRMKLWF